MRSPEDFAGGISRGAVAFLSSSFKGVFGSAHKLTGRLARGLTGLGDEQDERAEKLAARSFKSGGRSGVGGGSGLSGVRAGGAEFGRSVVSGLAGLVRRPVEGARSGGVGGFLKGVGRGVVGAVSKPVGGALGVVSATFEGMARTPEYLLRKARLVGALRERKRPVRVRCVDGFFCFCRGFCFL